MDFELRNRHACAECGVEIWRNGRLCKPCDGKRRIEAYSSGANPNWKGGRTIDKHGYVQLRVERGQHKPGTQQYVREHRKVWEDAHGPLPTSYIIHHLNGIKDDNRLENLAAVSRSDHHVRHAEPYERRIRELEEQLAAYKPA